MRRTPRIISGLLLIGFFSGYWLHNRTNYQSVYVLRLPSGPLFISEVPDHPSLRLLRRQEHLDPLIKGSRTDMDCLLRLMHWSSQLFPASTPFPHYPPWNALKILDQIRHKKTGGFCAQYALIFGQACQSIGYSVRYLGIANRSLTSGHALIEVYVPQHRKWIIFEPEYDRIYTGSDGVPLSALELHRYAVGEKRGNVLEFPSGKLIQPAWLALFYNFKYSLRTNFLSVPAYHYYQPQQGGHELKFEPYNLRWIDRYTASIPVSNAAIKSSREEDFNFPMDLSQKAVQRTCRTLVEFSQFVSQMEPLKLYRLALPQGVLTHLVSDVLIGDPRFKPLT
jgi:hypothetical protein